MKKSLKKILCMGLTASLLMMTAVGCSSAQQNEEEEEGFQSIRLKISSDYGTTLEPRIQEFQELHKNEVEINYVITDSAEQTQKEGILTTPQSAADIFMVNDDQFFDFYSAGALAEITENPQEVIEAVGGTSSAAAQAAMHDGKLYGYPLTSGNGYFLYYNKQYFSESDVQTLDGIMDIAAKNNAAFTMDFSSGWYLFSFFKGAGLTLEYNSDRTANICDWASTTAEHPGVSVAQALLNIADNPGFQNLPNSEFTAGAQDGSIIAGVSGPWHAAELAEVWGDNLAAAKLPTYTLDGEQLQMASFAGYKMLAVNAQSQNTKWAMRLAQYLTSEEAQLARFEESGECPANRKASLSEEVSAAPAVAALAAQAPYAYMQNVGDAFWDPSSIFGTQIADGNPDGTDLQDMLDQMVSGITS